MADLSTSPTRQAHGKRKQRDIDVFGQQREQEPRTPTRLRMRQEIQAEEQMDFDTDTETQTTAEAKAIVVSQLENLCRELKRFSDHHGWSQRTKEAAYTVAKKFMPELIAAGERRHADGNADSSRALQETAELRATVKDLAKAVNTLMACQEATPTQNGETQRPFQRHKGGERYSQRDQHTDRRPNPHSPKDQYHPARLIVIPHGEKFDTTQLNPRRTVNLINDRLACSENAKHLCVASAHYNYNQNLVIMLCEDQKGEELWRHAEEFIDIFRVPAHTIEMVTDNRQYKVRINGIWMGRDGEGEPNTPEDLLEEIERFNPVMSKVKLLSKPRWMRAEADLRGKDYSSVVLEFAKEEDTKTMLAVNQPKSRERTVQDNNTLTRLRTINLPSEQPVIISGDWNQHHPMWSKGDAEPAGKTRDLVEWLQENDFTLMNEKGKCTYHEHRRQGATSVLDLTWANTPAMALDATKEWAIDPNLACRSDHFALKWVIDHGATEVQNITGNRFNFKDMKPAAWQEAFQEEMKANTERWELLQDLNTNRTPEDLDKDVELITEAMKRATDRTVKIRKPLEKARPWWTEELTEANNERMALQENQQAYMARWGEPNRETDREIRKVTNYFRQLYKHKKREWIDKTLKEATPENMWGLQGWSKGMRNYPSPAIRRQNAGPAVEHEDKCDALCEALFKPLLELKNNKELDMELEQKKDFAHVKVTREEVKEEIYHHSTKKAPGVSQQPFNTVRWAWEAEEDTIFALMHHCIETGHHPKTWRRAVTVVLRKPKKPDYSEPRAYRLIQLLECLSKVLEGIVARRISHLVGREDLVPPTQFGGRPNSSTNNTLLTLVGDIQAARNHSKLKSTNPVIERLQEDWRGGEEGINPPPLPTQRKTRNKKLTKLTQIKKIEKMTYKPGKGENIDPFISPPWCKTARDHGNQLTVMGAPKKCKKAKEAQRHNKRLETMELDDTHLIIYSDGSMREDDMGGNTKIVGWGIVGYHKGCEVFLDRGGLGSNAEVYDTELVGIAQATKAATNYAKRKRQVRHVRIFADNMAAVTLAYGPKPMPGQLQMVKITHQVDTFLGEHEDRSIGIEWCPGHEKVKGNEHADEEAKKGAELWAQDHTTLTNAKRKSREKALKKWRSEWKKTLPTGDFAIANRLCPRWKPREHVVDLGILLGTKDGLKATAKFLEKSGAFTKTGTKQQQIKKPTEHDDENNEEEEAWWRRMERERETTDGLVEEEEEERYRDMDEEQRGDKEE
ncbi:putative 115 kDa protein in type-1 retrotransposable element [Termitomyces sp. T112]|nr:putative 115 kDa protein in type-1 retrotransposable element [Termitomyces sp. T112]